MGSIYNLLDASLNYEYLRNIKGFTPEEINMTNANKSARRFAKEHEYLFVVAKQKAAEFKEELIRAEFSVEGFDSVDASRYFLAVYVDDEVYRRTAVIMELEGESKRHGFMTQYSKAQEFDFYPFAVRQKHLMIEYLTEQEIDIPSYIENKILIDHFPLHDGFREDVENMWSGHNYFKIFLKQFIFADTESVLPIFILGSYFGEKIGIYFAWLTFYTTWLMYISIIGIVFSIFQLVEMSIDHYLLPLYTVLISIWMTLMNQLWKRRQSELVHLWNMSDFRAKAVERVDYKYELVVDIRNGGLIKQSYIRSGLRTILFSTPMVIFAFGLVIAAFIGFRIWSGLSDSFENSIIVGAVNGIAIFVLNYIYDYVAALLTDLENHQYVNDWEESYTVKIFGFQFVNCYISLFAIAFYDEDIEEIAYSVGSIFLAKQFMNYGLQVVWPYVLDWWFMRKLEKEFVNQGVPEVESKVINHLDTLLKVQSSGKAIINRDLEIHFHKAEALTPISDYCEMVIQIGYLTMFSSALPICPLFALIRNLLEIRGKRWQPLGEIHKYMYVNKRPVAMGVRSIGAWDWILDVSSAVNVVHVRGVHRRQLRHGLLHL